jgi:hypothetical protein
MAVSSLYPKGSAAAPPPVALMTIVRLSLSLVAMAAMESNVVWPAGRLVTVILPIVKAVT